MQVKLPKDMSDRVERASKQLGIKERELVDRAVLTYLDSISQFLNLKGEMEQWDKLSDEALMNFEKAL